MSLTAQFVDSIGPLLLNANPFFEVDTSGWVGSNATIARSTAQAHQGVASVLVTPNGVSASGGVNAATRMAVQAGEQYRASLWVYSSAGWSDLRPAVDWFTAVSGGSFITSSLGTAFVVPAGVWTYLEAVYTAPAGAAGATMRGRHGGTPTAGDVWFADEVTFGGTTRLRLDLNDHVTWEVKREGTSTPPPPLRRVTAGTPLVDGEVVPAAAYGNRSVIIALRCKAATADEAAAAVQALTRELHRPTNFLRWRPDTTESVYFRTLRSEYNELHWDPVQRKARLEILAEPHAYGPEEFPLGGPALNANPFFETDIANWTASGGASIVRSTAQAHEGVASLQLTPDGITVDPRVESERVPVTVGVNYMSSAWVRIAVARNVDIAIAWFTSDGIFLSISATPVALAANTWTFLSATFTAPATAGRASVMIRLTGTPPADRVTHIDEAIIQRATTAQIVNDPAVPGPILNANPFFEVDASGWTGSGGTFVRSTAQAHQGVASGLLTPDGVTAVVEAQAEMVPAVAGRAYRASCWVRCAVARNVAVAVNWHDAAGTFISQSVSTVAVSATTWTLLDLIATAPANTGNMRLIAGGMAATPLASHTLHIDEAMIREASGPGSMYVDITGVKGGVETPMILRADQADVNAVTGTAIGIRRRGVVADTPFMSQAETWTLLTDTTLQANDATASGAGSNHVRCSFGTNATMVDRMTVTHPTVPTDATRGLYRVFARMRRSSAAADTTIRVQLRRATITNPAATLALSTAWQWVDLGYLPIPGGADQAANFAGLALDSAGVALWLQAERVGPTAVTLDPDVFAFTPADDGFALVTWSTHGATGWTVLDGPLDAAYALDSAGRVVPVNPPPIAIPAVPMLAPGLTNRLYLVKRALGGADTLTEAVRLDVSYYPRYLFVRPVAG